ncbi:hypothetical protein GCM10023321_26360 [Pseudonocardia eucalypti]|uniref:DNA 3'-5' helicase n=2 Tax=Pseudonocardia eucalypti TaxID=648755 RepID=A0ABP9PYR3_9PSEU
MIEQLPPSSAAGLIPAPRSGVLAVPIQSEPAPPAEAPPPPADGGLFDLAELNAQIERAASEPLVEWMGFLHPAQNRLVRRSFNGPARVRGPAGTGKTVVMLHRAAWLAATRPGRVLITSFVRTMTHQLEPVYRRLSPQTVDRVDFLGIHELARQLLADANQSKATNGRKIEAAFGQAWNRVGARGPLKAICANPQYWQEEINNVIKGRGLRRLVEYERLERRGRSIPLTGEHKRHVWDLLIAYNEQLERRGTHDYNDLLSAAVDLVEQAPPEPGWSAVLVDEVQDLSMLGLKLCGLLAAPQADGLFLVGDGQQALYTGGFTLAEAGISVLGRATVLKVNYRNTRQIIDAAHQVVSNHEFFDLDPISERGVRDVKVVREGPPIARAYGQSKSDLSFLLVAAIKRDHHRFGVKYGEMAVLVHSKIDAAYLRDYLAGYDIDVIDLSIWDGEPDHRVKVGTVHRSKGLDFAAVYLPTFARSTNRGNHPDRVEREARRARQEFVGRTRARDRLWTGTTE